MRAATDGINSSSDLRLLGWGGLGISPLAPAVIRGAGEGKRDPRGEGTQAGTAPLSRMWVSGFSRGLRTEGFQQGDMQGGEAQRPGGLGGMEPHVLGRRLRRGGSPRGESPDSRVRPRPQKAQARGALLRGPSSPSSQVASRGPGVPSLQLGYPVLQEWGPSGQDSRGHLPWMGRRQLQLQFQGAWSLLRLPFLGLIKGTVSPVCVQSAPINGSR